MSQLALSFFCGLALWGGHAFPVNSDLNALILLHQPHVGQLLAKNFRVGREQVQKMFPGVVEERKSLVFRKNGEETIWTFNEKGELIRVVFTFNLKKWKSSPAERRLFKSHQSQMNEEALVGISSASRRLTITGGGYEFDVFFPVSDNDLPLIGSITLFGENHKK